MHGNAASRTHHHHQHQKTYTDPTTNSTNAMDSSTNWLFAQTDKLRTPPLYTNLRVRETISDADGGLSSNMLGKPAASQAACARADVGWIFGSMV
jgi:hypothetical protein